MFVFLLGLIKKNIGAKKFKVLCMPSYIEPKWSPMQKLIPPFLFLLCVIAMFFLDRYYPMQNWLASPYNFIGIWAFPLRCWVWHFYLVVYRLWYLCFYFSLWPTFGISLLKRKIWKWFLDRVIGFISGRW